MARRRLGASLLIVALVTLCCVDLVAARARACGPHPCCAKGVCKMVPKNAASRLDRCSDDQAKAPESPLMLTAITPLVIGLLTAPSIDAPAARSRDGSSLGVDRPPRV